MKKNFKSGYKKQSGKTVLKQFYLLPFFIFTSIPFTTNAQNCYCDEPGAITIGSDVGVETVQEVISLGFLDPNPSPLSPIQNICIKGDLSVSTNYNFINLKVNLYTGANIIVESFIQLSMSGDRKHNQSGRNTCQ